MRIEDIDEEKLTGMSNTDLYNLRLRAVQIFNKHFDKKAAAAAGTLKRADLLAKYELVRKEMHGRGLHPTWEALDGYLLHNKMWGLDPTLMGDIVLEPNCVIAGGKFTDNPRDAEACDIFVSPGMGYPDEVKKALNTRITKQISKPVEFHFGQESIGGSHMPLFDLVLRPVPTLKMIKQPKAEDDTSIDKVLHCPDCATSVLRVGQFAHGLIKCPDCGAFVTTTEPPVSKVYQDDELVIRKPGFEETENEIRYRIREPGRFQEGSFRRIALQSSKPRVYGIIGRLTGETTTTLQSLRFPKGDGWTIPKARSWVRAHPDAVKKESDLLDKDVLKFTHNSAVRDDEPQWGGVDKTKLPRLAFANVGEADQVSTWGYPHHFVEGGGNPDDKGRYTTGTMYLHVGGLNAAWAAAQGARAGQEASGAIKAHLNAHRKAIGRKEASVGFEVKKVEDEWEHVVGGAIYIPEEVDAQGDVADAEEIRKAAWGYMESSQRIKIMHKGRDIRASVLESYIVQADFQIGGQEITKGTWWMTVRIRDESAWAAVLDGTFTGFSMGGIATSV